MAAFIGVSLINTTQKSFLNRRLLLTLTMIRSPDNDLLNADEQEKQQTGRDLAPP